MKEKKEEKMEEEKTREESDLGTIKIHNEVISTIASRAATEAKGVAGLSGGVVDGLAKMIGRRNPEKGVKVEIADDDVNIDMSILVEYGVSIPTVCRQIQGVVRSRVEEMTGKNVKSININVHGIHFPERKAKSSVKDSVKTEEEKK